MQIMLLDIWCITVADWITGQMCENRHDLFQISISRIPLTKIASGGFNFERAQRHKIAQRITMIRSYLTSHSFQKCNTDLSIANKQNFLLEYFIADAFPDNAIFKISLSSNMKFSLRQKYHFIRQVWFWIEDLSIVRWTKKQQD